MCVTRMILCISLSCSLILHASGDAPLNPPTPTRAKRHGDITSSLSGLAALGSQIVVPDEVRLVRAKRSRRAVCNSAIATARGHGNAGLVAGTPASVVAIGTVDQRDIVPESVGDAVFKLCNAVGPEAGRIAGDLERGMAIEGFGERAAGADGGLVVGRGAEDGDLVAAVVLDNGLAS